jgi:hypothetical protein
MGTNFIVLRASPDWLNFDLEETREFLRDRPLPKTVVIDFARIWDAVMRVDYRHFRARVKEITLANYRSVKEATLLSLGEFRERRLAADDLVIFVDDDDWLAPDLFLRLRLIADGGDGVKWGSIRVGLVFETVTEVQFDSVFHIRAVDDLIYTNNCAIKGAMLMRRGIEFFVEHRFAYAEQQAGLFRPTTLAQYLSAANKHPCSTLAANAMLKLPGFRADPVAPIRTYARALAALRPPMELAWLAAPIAALAALVDSAVDKQTPQTS